MHRVGKCFGLCIWKWGKTYIEIWLCLSGVGPHIHPEQASEIVPLFGWALFARVVPPDIVEFVKISPRFWLRTFTVHSGMLHWFNTKFLIFLNVSDRSAATNIVYQ